MSLLLFIFATAILVVANLESFGVATIVMSALLHLAALGLGLLLLVTGNLRSHARHRRIGTSLFVAAIAAIAVMVPIQRSQQARSKATGDAVCAALDAWRNRHGRHPATLQELVPELLPSAPTTAMGLWSTIPFRYRCDQDGDDYWPAFDSPQWVVCERGRHSPWVCKD